MRWFLPALIATLTTIAAPVAADCGGPSLLDQLTAAETAALQTQTSQIPYASGTQWIATRGADTVTLIGTLHLADPRLAPVHAGLQDAVAAADVVLLEATPFEMALAESEFATNPDLMFITDGPTLPERLDDATWNALAEAATARQIPPFLAAKMQPWFLSMSLAIPACAMANIAAQEPGLDQMIMGTAEYADTPMLALEAYDTLFDIFRSGTPDEQLEALKLSLLAPDLQQAMHIATLDAYFDEDIGKLIALSRVVIGRFNLPDVEQASQMMAEIERAVLDDRNRAWMPVIAKTMQSYDDAVLAVGAAHLPGDVGLLRLLEAEGWTISPR